MTGASKNHKVHYNPKTVHKTTEELQIHIFLLIEKCKISLSALDASDPRPAACDFIEFT